MKVTCDSCHTRYAIPDERVTGKVVLIRCKKCQGVVRVVGPTQAFDADVHRPPPTLTHVIPQNLEKAGPTSTPDPIWWVGIEGHRHGPYSATQIADMVCTGDINARTLMWAAPWIQWERVAESPALRWVVELCVKNAAENIALTTAEDPFAGFSAFEDAGLLSDGSGYFPDPTLHTGWMVLDERTQRSLETWARRADHPVESHRGSMLATAAAFATGVMMAVGGIAWLAHGAI